MSTDALPSGGGKGHLAKAGGHEAARDVKVNIPKANRSHIANNAGGGSEINSSFNVPMNVCWESSGNAGGSGRGVIESKGTGEITNSFEGGELGRIGGGGESAHGDSGKNSEQLGVGSESAGQREGEGLLDDSGLATEPEVGDAGAIGERERKVTGNFDHDAEGGRVVSKGVSRTLDKLGGCRKRGGRGTGGGRDGGSGVTRGGRTHQSADKKEAKATKERVKERGKGRELKRKHIEESIAKRTPCRGLRLFLSGVSIKKEVERIRPPSVQSVHRTNNQVHGVKSCLISTPTSATAASAKCRGLLAQLIFSDDRLGQHGYQNAGRNCKATHATRDDK